MPVTPSAADPPVVIEVRLEVFFYPLEGLHQELSRIAQLSLELLDALLERGGSIGLVANLAVLNEVPKKSHAGRSVNAA